MREREREREREGERERERELTGVGLSSMGAGGYGIMSGRLPSTVDKVTHTHIHTLQLYFNTAKTLPAISFPTP